MNRGRRRYIIWVETILLSIMILIVLSVVVTTTSMRQSAVVMGSTKEAIEEQIVLITDELMPYATRLFIEGLLPVSQAHPIVINHQIVDGTEEALRRAFDLAIFSKAQGIIIKLQQNSRAKDYIDKAYDKGIAVVVVDHDAPGSKRDAYIGTNKLLLGKKAGQMVFKYGEVDSQTLIILGSDYTDPSGSATNNYMNGFRQVMEESKLSADILIAYASQNHVELILEEALIEGHINVVVCTDPQDTIRVMHQLIDFNRVKDIVLIGSGDLPQIQQAVRDGIIKASVVVDYKQMGVEAMEAYLSLTRGLAQTAYKTIPIDVLE